MKLIFQKITIDNFLSFKHCEISLSDRGYTLVSGINERAEDSALSNGSGKSSIWEAIIWSLTGETIRGTKSVNNLYVDDGPAVELLFTADNDEYRVIRAKDNRVHKTNLKIFINGEDKSGKGIADSKKLLSEYLPDLTAELLGSVIILGQGMPQRFTNNTPAERKAILERLSKSDFMIEDLKKRVADRKVYLSTKLREFEDEITAANAKKTMLEGSLVQLQEKLTTLDSKALKQTVDEINASLIPLTARLVEQKNTLAELESKSNRIQQQIAQVDAEKQTKLLEIENESKDALFAITQRLAELKAKLSAQQTQLSQMKQVRDVCPTCGQRIIGVVKPDTSALEGEISLCKAEIESLNITNNEKQKQRENKKSQVSQVYNEKKSSLYADQQQINSDILSLRKEIIELESSISEKQRELNTATSSLSGIEMLIRDTTQHIEENKNAIDELAAVLLYNTNERDKKQEQLKIQNSFETALKRDFRGYLLTNVINFLNCKAKEYSQYVFGTENISICLNNNSLDISYDGKQYENLSGGEKQKVDLITQFSIRDMLTTFMNFSCNCIVLDEIFDNLDAAGCQKVLDMISNKLTDTSSIFIVTHHSDIQIPCDSELVVVKNKEGISSIR